MKSPGGMLLKKLAKVPGISKVQQPRRETNNQLYPYWLYMYDGDVVSFTLSDIQLDPYSVDKFAERIQEDLS